MMSKRDEVTNRTKKMILPGCILGIVVLVALWTMAILATDETELLGLRKTAWLTLAAVLSIAGPPILFFAVRNRLYLLKNGDEVVGEVVGLSPFKKSSSTPVTYSYTYKNQQYTFKRDTALPLANEMEIGGKVVLLVDRYKPKNVTILDHRPNFD